MRTAALATLLCVPLLSAQTDANADADAAAVTTPVGLRAGPMLGHVGPRSARLWLQVAYDADVPCVIRSGDDTAGRAPWWVQDLGAGCRVIGFERLAPDTPFEIEVGRGDAAVRLRSRTAPLPSDHGRVRFAFGSCAKPSQYPEVPVFTAMAAARPDLALFVGDNAYFIVGDGSRRNFRTTGPVGDWSSPARMRARHLVLRTAPALQRLLRTTPCYAIWDDHDYGPNNADRSFPLRDAALRVFRQVWANPGYGTDAVPGVFSRFRRGPVEFFLMDDRFHKYVAIAAHPDVPAAERTIWGRAQTDWLLRGLRTSTAPVKVVANGTQFLHQGDTGEGHWREARAEWQRVLDALAEHDVGGVMFVSGDRHYSELMRLRRDAAADLVEFTSSPLAQNRRRSAGPTDRANPTRLWCAGGDSFGLVTIDVRPDGTGSITCEALDTDGAVLAPDDTPRRTTFPLSDLQP